MLSPFILEQVLIECDLALGKTTEAEAIARMLKLNAKALRFLLALHVLAAIVPVVVIGGLALLAWRLGSFS